MSTDTYYALWYHFRKDKRSAMAISTCAEFLPELHDVSAMDPGCPVHDPGYMLDRISISPILCYTFHATTRTLAPYCEGDALEDGAFYAVNYYPLDPGRYMDGEVLVYLSDMMYQTWCKCSALEEYTDASMYPDYFYNEIISDAVKLDTYYDRGIMNR